MGSKLKKLNDNVSHETLKSNGHVGELGPLDSMTTDSDLQSHVRNKNLSTYLAEWVPAPVTSSNETGDSNLKHRVLTDNDKKLDVPQINIDMAMASLETNEAESSLLLGQNTRGVPSIVPKELH